MKKSRICGMAVLALAVIALIAGAVGASMRSGGEALSAAQARSAAVNTHREAREKLAPSTVKKAESAVSAAQSAEKAVEEARSGVQALDEKKEAGRFGDEVIDALIEAGAREVADKRIFALYEEQYNAALKAVNDGEKALIAAQEGIASTYAALDISYEISIAQKTGAASLNTKTDFAKEIGSLASRAEEVTRLAEEAQAYAQNASNRAEVTVAGDSLSVMDRVLLLITGGYIGVLFTGLVLLIIALALLLIPDRFVAAWRKYPIFSTFIALLGLMVVQVYALGFEFDSIGEWFSSWLGNALNVLRSNSAVGMIALGMTLVIITGGIDLAVGSTLAGVATVVMVLMDVSPNGWLTGLGVTGMPNYLIAVGAGLLSGLAVGALTGLGVTKGRIPPFIITLGVMNIVRSVAQYFTKGYKVEVPRDFQVFANAEIGGQMLLPIFYWLILAVIMYVISKHTAFGRHIYAVGSNERTSRLSGINVGRVKLGVYMMMGLIVAIAAIMQVARLRGVDVASAGSGYEMNAIAAVVVGGTSMAGGRGSIEGTVLGVLIIGIMNNLLVLLSIDAFLASAFTGAIIIAAVLTQRKEG